MNRSSLFALALVCQFTLIASARAAEPEREADHVALRELRNKVAAGISDLNMDALSSCFAREFAFTTVTQTVLTNKAQIQAYFDEMFRSKGALLKGLKTEPTADIKTRFTDENTGYCYGSTVDTYTLNSGQVVSMTNRWTATVVKEDGQWKVALAQVGTDFMNNPLLTKVTSLWRGIAIAAGIGGALLGVFLGLIMARRRTGTGVTQQG